MGERGEVIGYHATRVASIFRHDDNPLTTLWCAVIAYAITSDPLADALAWLRSKDGRQVCALAGFEPDRVARIAHRLDAERRGTRIAAQ